MSWTILCFIHTIVCETDTVTMPVLAVCLINSVLFWSSYKSLSADNIRPRCMDDDPGFRRCDSGQLTFNEEMTLHFDNSPTVNITRYEQVYGQYAAYRPLYKAISGSSSVNVYLYHADGTWRLGHGYTTSTSEFARVSDTALRPEFITGVWQLHYNQVWRNNNNLKLRCTGIFYLQCQCCNDAYNNLFTKKQQLFKLKIFTKIEQVFHSAQKHANYQRKNISHTTSSMKYTDRRLT